jgi:hypothetical protein
LGRLRPGVTIAQADAELNSVAEQQERQYRKSNSGWRVRLTSIKDWIVNSDSRTSLYVMMTAAGLLLLGACANVAALVVTRATARSHEFGVRLALGAGQVRLVRQLATETLVLALSGRSTRYSSCPRVGSMVGNTSPKSIATQHESHTGLASPAVRRRINCHRGPYIRAFFLMVGSPRGHPDVVAQGRTRNNGL